MEFRRDINGLRAIAVLAVMFYHFKVAPFGGGFVGVDIFFVISGYLMSKIIIGGVAAGAFSPWRFWLARARRIVPALAVMCIVVVGFGLLFIEPVSFEAMAKEVASSISFVSNIQYYFESGYFDATSEAKWLLHTWSLSVEWQFYLLYPLFLLGASKLAPRYWRVLAVVGLVLASFVFCVLMDQLKPSFAFYELPTRAWEMAMGGCVLLAEKHFGRLGQTARRGVEVVGLAMVLASVVLVDRYMVWPSPVTLVPVIGTALVILAQAEDRSFLGLKLFQWLGLRSYSIYLWHWPIVVGLYYFGQSGLAWSGAGILVSIGLGWLSYRLVENPVRDLSKASPRRGLAVLAGLFCLPLMLGACAAALHGLPGRGADPAAVKDTIAARSDWSFPAHRCDGVDPLGHLRLCSIGDASVPHVLVLGDSHAEEWWSRFQKTVPEAGRAVSVAATGGCPPILGIDRVKPDYHCPAFVDRALKEAADGPYDRVVLLSFWDGYFPTDSDGLNRLCLSNGRACIAKPERGDMIRIAAQRLTQEVALLVSHGRKVVIVLPMPTPGVVLPEEIAKRRFIGRSLAGLTSEPRADFLRGTADITGALREVAAKTGADLVDPTPDLCDAQTCPFVDAQNRSLFRDGNHVRESDIQNDRYRFIDQAAFGAGSAPVIGSRAPS